MRDELTVGVGVDYRGWHDRSLKAFRDARSQGAPVRATLVDLHAHDWIEKALGFDALVFNPAFMGPVSASFFKEKLYFLEAILGLRVMPNYASAWHFESKVAQSYLFSVLDVPRPRTVVSFEHADAAEAAGTLGLPVVAKKSHGAASMNVRLLRTQRELDRYLETEFAQQIWDERKGSRSAGGGISDVLSVHSREKLRRHLLSEERHGYVYLQEFLPGNAGDLRVYVVGRRIAGIHRANRKGDFRASGSGLIDDQTPLPEDAMELCIRTRERIGADCLAFDVLYRGEEPVLTEMSYSMDETAWPRHWVSAPDGTLTCVEGEIENEGLWVRHLLDEFGL